jgi:AraC family multidrug resistance transcriptional activator
MLNRGAEGESNMTISAQVIDTIVEWIDDNLHQPLRIEEIARHAGYSKWHLQRLFMQYKGESLGRYIRERKLLLAARDLRESDEKVYDICLRYGFDSQQTFTRVFTRWTRLWRLLTPIEVNKENIDATVIKDGFHKKSEL